MDHLCCRDGLRWRWKSEASLPVQRWERKGKLLEDPMHIVTVNGDYKRTDTLEGQVIHDIMTTDPRAMLVPEIQKPFADLKETEKGQREMTEALEHLVHERELRTIEKVVRNMAVDGAPFEQIVKYTGSSADEVQKIIDRIGIDSQPQLS